MGDDANVGRGHGGHHQANGNPFQVNCDDGDDEQDDDVDVDVDADYDGTVKSNGSVVILRWERMLLCRGMTISMILWHC